MKLFKKMRKGFTLIELVVVIAVIAILSAVAIVSYLSITNKAKQSNDQQKINQVNLSLAANEISGKPKTMYDALQGVKEDGFLPENFKAESKDYVFAYKMSENRFVILQKGKVVYPTNISTPESEDLWKFASKESELESSYSYYLLKGFTSDGELNVNAGLDVGENTDITSIEYANSGAAKNVVVRTNSFATTLTVKAPSDTVKHFGNAAIINVNKIAGASYHEYGTVGRLTIDEGHAVAEPSAVIFCFNDNGSSTTATAEVKTGAIVYDVNGDDKGAEAIVEGTHSDCGAGHHEFGSQLVIDNKVYEVCKSCGYTLITVVDPAGNQTKATMVDSEGEIVNTPIETYNSSATNGNGQVIQGQEDPIVETPVVTEEMIDNSCKHLHWTYTSIDDDNHKATCDSCGLSFVEAHTYVNNICTKCGYQNIVYVAQVESTKYEDALTAFKVAKLDNKSVTILANCSVFADDLPDDVDFDLNGKTLSKTYYKKVASADGENIFVDFWGSWKMQGMKDENGNECPQYILVSDETLYRDEGVLASDSEAWVSAKYVVENYTSCCSFYEIVNEPVSVFDGNTTAFKYFANGNGSQAKPYIIENVEQFKNMGKLSDYSLVDSTNYDTMFEKKTNKCYYINVTASSLDFSSVSGAIWQLTAASQSIEASGFNVNIDFNDCEIKGKSLTFGSTGEYMGETLYDPNFGISYAAGYFLGYVYDRTYSVTIKNAKFTNCGVDAENGVSLTLDNCSFDCSSYTRLRSYQDKASTAGAVNHIIKDCKFNNCYIEFGGGSGSSYEINTQFINCEFTKEQTSGYNSTVKYDSYTYGNLSFDGCTMTVNLGQNYNPIKIETNQSYIGEHSVSLTIKDTTINWTSAIGTYDSGVRVPVSKGIATIIEQGTNSYIVNETALNYDGSAIGE